MTKKGSFLSVTTAILFGLPAVALANVADSVGSQSYVVSRPQSSFNVFAGIGGGYLTEVEEGFFSTRFGMSMLAGGVEHLFFIDVLGFEGEGIAPALGNSTYDVNAASFTLNYGVKIPFSGNIFAEVGGGVGVGTMTYSEYYYNRYGYSSYYSEDDSVLTTQAFARIGIDITPNFAIYGGTRYLYMEDSSLFNGGLVTNKISEVGVELGLRFKF